LVGVVKNNAAQPSCAYQDSIKIVAKGGYKAWQRANVP
jgi:hypothetical protein